MPSSAGGSSGSVCPPGDQRSLYESLVQEGVAYEGCVLRRVKSAPAVAWTIVASSVAPGIAM